jgi:hypothetical protein
MLLQSIEENFRAILASQTGGAEVGHAHFWDRALSRRQMLGRTAGLAGAAVGAAYWLPGMARGATLQAGAPRPIPGGTQVGPLGFFHFFFPTGANPAGATATIDNGLGDPSTIFDFHGSIGVGDFGGGTGKDQSGRTRYWAADVRFMTGTFVDLDGRVQQGAFSFI